MEAIHLKQILGLLVPLLALMIPIVAIVAGVRQKMARDAHMHETVRALAEKGQSVPPELLAAFLGHEQPSRWTALSNLRGGVINVAVGLGLMLMFFMIQPDGWLWSIGAVPLALGLGLLLLWRIESTRGL